MSSIKPLFISLFGILPSLLVSTPTFASPMLTEATRSTIPIFTTNRFSDRVTIPQASGRVSYPSSVSGIDCQSITVSIEQSIPNTFDYQTANSAQAQGDYQRDGFCSYAFAVPGASSYISSSSYRTRANDGYWSAMSETFGGDLVLYPTLH